MRNFFFYLFIFGSLSLFAQDLDPETAGARRDPDWQTSYSSLGFLSTSLSRDAQGNVFSAGTFQTAMEAGGTSFQITAPHFRESFPNQPFLQKHTAQGELLWTVYGIGRGRVNDVLASADGSVFITGELWEGYMIFVSADGKKDSLPMPKKAYRGLYLAKFSSEGQLLNTSFYNGLDHACGVALAMDSQGRIIVAGNYMWRNGVELKRNWLLMRYQADLSLDWLQAGDSIGRSMFLDVVVDHRDAIYAAGWYADELHIENDTLKVEHHDQMGLAVKWDEGGKLEWLQGSISYEGLGGSQSVVNAIAVDRWRRVYLTGTQFQRLYIARLKRNGKRDWYNRSKGRSSYPFGMLWNGRDLVVYGHGYGSSFLNYDLETDYAYLAKASTDFFVLQASRRGKWERFLLGGGYGTDYATGAVIWEDQLIVLGHDLGGVPIEFDKIHLPKGRPRVWLASWAWD